MPRQWLSQEHTISSLNPSAHSVPAKLLGSTQYHRNHLTICFTKYYSCLRQKIKDLFWAYLSGFVHNKLLHFLCADVKTGNFISCNHCGLDSRILKIQHSRYFCFGLFISISVKRGRGPFDFAEISSQTLYWSFLVVLLFDAFGITKLLVSEVTSIFHFSPRGKIVHNIQQKYSFSKCSV